MASRGCPDSRLSTPKPRSTTTGRELRLIASQRLSSNKDSGLVDREWLLELAYTLQTTLDTKKVIELFATELDRLLPGVRVQYYGYQGEIEIEHTEPSQYACAYSLVLEEKNLGTIVFTRSRPFVRKIQRILENTLCTLVYPLRNALLYNDALNTATRDPLTGVHNRTSLSKILKREVDLAHRHSNPLSVIMLDVDQFKAVNDTYGHLVGDCALKVLADCIKACIRDSDMVFRYGGEEFLIVLSNTNTTGAAFLAERLRNAVQTSTICCHDISLSITVSLGVATLETGDDCVHLLLRADQALYETKSLGRNRVTTYNKNEGVPAPCVSEAFSPASSS